jgi:hypothetical protein
MARTMLGVNIDRSDPAPLHDQVAALIPHRDNTRLAMRGPITAVMRAVGRRLALPGVRAVPRMASAA